MRIRIRIRSRNTAFVDHFCPPGSGSGSTDPIGSGSIPDPQPWGSSLFINENIFSHLKALPGGCAPLHAGRLAAGVRPVGPGHERPDVRR
jgi:hypothetical protein